VCELKMAEPFIFAKNQLPTKADVIEYVISTTKGGSSALSYVKLALQMN
jgi:hypothetical protein